MIDLKNIRKVYFIGIGGIGMSAIARMLVLHSFSEAGSVQVTGSDRASSLVTEELEKLGIKIFYEQKAENITPDVDLVIYTIAITEDNPELKKARELGIKCLTYPEMLGVISDGKFTIAVAGTHGKTTTTAMIAEVMIEAGLDPTVIVGSLLKPKNARPSLAKTPRLGLKFPETESRGSNFIAGKSKYLIVEACEYRRSFLNLHPTLAVVTNIDNDHLDYYKDLADIKNAFDQFLAQSENKIVDYQKYLAKVPELLVPGEHNRLNAAATLAVADFLNIEEEVARRALAKFTGTWRRFEFKGKTKNGAIVYDDYAHHPTEISASLAGAREFMKKRNLAGRLIVAFQPHLYSRTKLLKDDFASALAGADEIILAPIYAAREPNDPEISSDILADLIKTQNTNVSSPPNLEEVKNYVIKNSKEGDLVITMGAGDIGTVGDKLVESRG
ncbi:MAG: UDP-N-acetylmuramate--L-alanine ligase [Candidatus Vogelbacteria bacterium]|nr:UDP-N-acetylmuramate--L-alanine ligase [Candidatus Vogelbacteria bacterium]